MADKNVSVLTSGSYTGSQTVREFEVTDLKVEDGKLNGTAIGSVEKEGTGIVDKVRLSFTDVPFEGVGGGAKVYEVVKIVTASLKMGAAKWMELYNKTDGKCYAFWCGVSFDNGSDHRPVDLKTRTSGRKIVAVYAVKDDIAPCSGVSVNVDYSYGGDLLGVPVERYSTFTDCQIRGTLVVNGTMPIDTTTGVDLYAVVEGEQ